MDSINTIIGYGIYTQRDLGYGKPLAPTDLYDVDSIHKKKEG
jgi:hypothetical protein